jgi:predicted  nucleic acid-binding Zn-ribbon protein
VDQESAPTLSVTKQKQRISFLQKKLEIAERDLKKEQEEVERLHGELHLSQLALIGKQIENYEQQMRKYQADPRHKMQGFHGDEITLFLKERELLQSMLEEGPSPEAFEAQVVLDRILRMITELKEVQEAR